MLEYSKSELVNSAEKYMSWETISSLRGAADDWSLYWWVSSSHNFKTVETTYFSRQGYGSFSSVTLIRYVNWISICSTLRQTDRQTDITSWQVARLQGQKVAIAKMINVHLPTLIPYPTAFPYGNGMVLHFYQQQESSTTKTVHKVINKGLKAYV